MLDGSEDAHQDALGGGALVGGVGVAVLSHDHSWPNRAFGVVIVKRHVRLVEKREQIVLIFVEAFDQSFGLAICAFVRDELTKANIDPLS